MNLFWDKFRFNKDKDKGWFISKVVDGCNRLSSHIVSVCTIDPFKKRLNESLDSEVR